MRIRHAVQFSLLSLNSNAKIYHDSTRYPILSLNFSPNTLYRFRFFYLSIPYPEKTLIGLQGDSTSEHLTYALHFVRSLQYERLPYKA